MKEKTRLKMSYVFYLKIIYCTLLVIPLLMIVSPIQAEKKNDVPVSSLSVPSYQIQGWNPVREFNGVSTYTLSDDRETVGIFYTQSLEKSLSWQEARSKKFFDQVNTNKKEILSAMGITNWKMSFQKWKKKKGYLEWNVKGSYNNSSGELIYFKENHLYFSDRVQQVLMTSSGKAFFEGRENERFIKLAQKEMVRVAVTKQKSRKQIVKADKKNL